MSSLPFVHSPLSLLLTLHSNQGKRLFRPSKPYSANTSICLFCEKKSVAKAKVFFLLIQSALFPTRATPLNPLIHLHSSTTAAVSFRIHCCSNGFGGFASQWLQAPNQSNLGRKSWTQSSWGKKSIFPWKSHAVQLARVSRKDVEILGIFFHFLHSHVPFLFFIFRNLPNPKLLVHGLRASYVSKHTVHYDSQSSSTVAVAD